MKILVTGTRAPASMDLMRSLIRQGHQVYSMDSMRFPLGRFVKGVTKHFTVPKPNRDLNKFLAAIKSILIEYKIDLLIPTCEEIFFISQGHDELSKYTRLLLEPFDRLTTIHNKYLFNQLAHEYGLHAPESWLLTKAEDKEKLPKGDDIVLKPIYSRFGSHVLIKPTQIMINELPLNVPYIAQRFISGKEYCAYAIAHEGKTLIHSCYHPKYTTGPAAGIYFEPAELKSITDFINTFCQRYCFTGQIAFDFILQDNKAFVLECNPRITSGFHLISDQINWEAILSGQQQAINLPQKPFMIGLAMKMKFLSTQSKQFRTDYRNAHDVLKGKSYPWLGVKSLITVANITMRMMAENKSFHRASTDDIEFNG